MECSVGESITEGGSPAAPSITTGINYIWSSSFLHTLWPMGITDLEVWIPSASFLADSCSFFLVTQLDREFITSASSQHLAAFAFISKC